MLLVTKTFEKAVFGCFLRCIRRCYVRKIQSVSVIRKGPSEIWIDKLKVLYNRHTESRRDGGKGNVTEVPTAQRATEV